MRFTYSSGQRPLEGYTLKRGIGRGGFGEVYYAVSDGGKEVALKLVNANTDIELRGMSQCLNVKHSNLVALYDLRSDSQGHSWVVMEYVAGESLSAILARNASGVAPDLARQWFGGLAAAIAYLHDQGIVHRDLKPANIFVENGLVKVGDYGLSKLIGGSQVVGQTQSVGTVHYMAPEISTGNYNRSIDLYAAGVILYEMLTGHVPFDGESAGEILMKHLTAPPDLSKVSSPFVPILDQALAKNPAKRYRQISDMAREVAATASGRVREWESGGEWKSESSRATTSLSHAPPRAATLPPSHPVTEPAGQAVPTPRIQVAELCVALLKSAFLAAPLTLGGTMLFAMDNPHDIAKAFFLTLACCWAILIPAKLWQTPMEESWLRRTVLLILGLGIGLEALWLDGFTPASVWANEPGAGHGPNPWQQVFVKGQLPLAASYLAFFGLAFFATRWWKVVERQRPRRFSFGAVFAAAFWGYVLIALIPGLAFPDPGFIALVAAAVILQSVSPWEAPAHARTKRFRLRYSLEGRP